MENDNKQFQRNDVFSKRIRAGKRRTYFFDVRTTKGNDYYLTVTESKKRFHDDGYERHKIFVYKEDFNKFISTLEEVIDHIKTNLMPGYDFDQYTRDPEDITHGEDDDLDHGDRDEESGDRMEYKSSREDKSTTSGTGKAADEEVISWD